MFVSVIADDSSIITFRAPLRTSSFSLVPSVQAARGVQSRACRKLLGSFSRPQKLIGGREYAFDAGISVSGLGTFNRWSLL